MNCGCGRKLGFEFFLMYEHEEPHCKPCFKEVIDTTSTAVLVRKTDAAEYRKERGLSA